MKSDPTPAVAGEIDAWCTRCKLLLNHIVVAKLDGKVKRVQCLTCGGQHAYSAGAARGAARGAAATSTAGTSAPAVRKKPARSRAPIDDDRPARPYATGDAYAAGDAIQHPQYGRGLVAQTRGDKIDVEFATGAKTLVHRRPPA